MARFKLKPSRCQLLKTMWCTLEVRSNQLTTHNSLIFGDVCDFGIHALPQTTSQLLTWELIYVVHEFRFLTYHLLHQELICSQMFQCITFYCILLFGVGDVEVHQTLVKHRMERNYSLSFIKSEQPNPNKWHCKNQELRNSVERASSNNETLMSSVSFIAVYFSESTMLSSSYTHQTKDGKKWFNVFH